MAAFCITKNSIFNLAKAFPHSPPLFPRSTHKHSRVCFTSASKHNKGRNAEEDKDFTDVGRETTKEGVEKAKERAEQAREQSKEMKEKAKERAEEMKEKAKGYAHKTKQSAKGATQSAAKKTKKVHIKQQRQQKK